MTLITPTDPNADPVSLLVVPPIVAIAAEALLKCAPVNLNSDGEIEMSNATLANAAGAFLGITPRAAAAGEPASIYGIGTQFNWSSAGALTPGATYYIGATDGTIDDTATTGDNLGSFKAIDTKVLVVTGIRNIGVAVVV